LAGAKTGVPPCTGLRTSGDENAKRRLAASSGDGILCSSFPFGGGILISGGPCPFPFPFPFPCRAIEISGELVSSEIAPPNNEKFWRGAMNGEGSIVPSVEVDALLAAYVRKGEVGDGVGNGR
jgi:hypothetical protein